MNGKEENILKNSLGVSLATFASRLLGLVRVKLEAYALGGGTVASIWFMALMIPNLLRRLLGEGALGSALTPVIADTEKNGGIPQARLQLAQVLSMLGALLALIVVIAALGAWLFGTYASAHGYPLRITGVCELLPLMLPYTFFICLTGVITAVLNYAGMFIRPALTSLLFNLCMIFGMASGVYLELPEKDMLALLAVLLPAGGMVQFFLMLWMLKLCGRFPLFSRETFSSLAVTWKILKIAAPGIASYGVLQVSFLIDRLLAVSLGDQAVPALSFVDRIIDLPIGLFAVAMGSVLMASMTRAAAAADWDAMREQLNFSMRHVWFVCAPMAAGVIFFHPEILRVLCLGGKYTENDLNAASLVAVFYGMGIPLFCSMKIIQPAFYSRKDMKRPFYVSLAAISCNIVLNLILMIPLEQGGLALATVISSAVNNTLLLTILAKEGFKIKKRTVFSALRSVVIALISGSGTWLLLPFIRRVCSGISGTGGDICILGAVIIIFSTVYFLFTVLCSAPELAEFINILRRKKSPKKEKISADC